MTSFYYRVQLLLDEQWGGLSRKNKEISCLSMFYAINWIRELVKFCVHSFVQFARIEALDFLRK